MMNAAPTTSRPEAVFVLLLLQAILWMVAGLSALPFALAGEVQMIGLGLATLLLALFVCLMGIGVLWRRRSARRAALVVEVICLLGAALTLLPPLGANRGPVALLVDVALPVAVIWLLWRRRARAVFT
jgi:hypothetical protein